MINLILLVVLGLIVFVFFTLLEIAGTKVSLEIEETKEIRKDEF